MTPGTDRRPEFVGSWRLESHYFRAADGSTADGPCGPGAEGVLIYGADGYMSAALMRVSTPSPGASEGRPPVPYMGYSGKWRTDGPAVIHAVAVSSHSRIVGTEQIRLFKFDGDRLTLCETLPDGARSLVLHWRRA